VWRRAWTLYVAHIFLFVLFVAQVSYTAATFKNPMYYDEMRAAEFLDEPHVAIVRALPFRFQSAFLDILPMRIILLLIFPAVLLGSRRRWLLLLSPSAALAHLNAEGHDFRGCRASSSRSPRWFSSPRWSSWSRLRSGGMPGFWRAGRHAR
jgi:hypothetical protein